MTTHPDYRALLAHVLAAPDDDAPRLVLADWLREHGEDEYADFIARQVRTCSIKVGWGDFELMAVPAYTAALGQKPAYLVESNEYPFPQWVKKLPPVEWPGTRIYRRGFVFSVTLTAHDWLDHGDAILAEHPVTEVRLTTRIQAAQYTPDTHQLSAATQEEIIREKVGPVSDEVRQRIEETVGLGMFSSGPEYSRRFEEYVRIVLSVRWPRVRTWHLPPEPMWEERNATHPNRYRYYNRPRAGVG